MANGLLSTAELEQATGYRRPRDIERCLEQAGVRYFPGKDGPWTTIDLINAAGGLRSASNDPYPIDLHPTDCQ